MTQKKVSLVIYIALLVLCVFVLGYLAGTNHASTEIQVLVGEPTTIERREEVAAVSEESQGLIDINTADRLLLQTLPGIGPELADRIISYREQLGGFSAIEQIKDVPGIGDKRYESLVPFITVGGNT